MHCNEQTTTHTTKCAMTSYFYVDSDTDKTGGDQTSQSIGVCRWSAEGEPRRAVALMKRLQTHGFEPSLYTYETVVWGFAQVSSSRDRLFYPAQR